MKHLQVYMQNLAAAPRLLGKYWRSSWLHKAVIITISVVLVAVGGMYGIARWYIWSERGTPQVLGATFIPAYAESLGLNAPETMDALINQLGVRQFRLVSYWDQMEPSPGQYNFSTLDWQFKKAEAVHAKVSLSVGLRQPRWPECHMPAWAAGEPQARWQPQLQQFIAAVVNRYKYSPSLQSYQLENEYFLRGFSPLCTNFDRSRLVAEYNLVKKTDPGHEVIISRSNNALGFPVGAPTPDEFGISIYKRVWDAGVTHRYLEYPFPAWFYAFLAGTQKIFTGRDMIVHELQAEAWPPNGQTIAKTSLTEQNKSFNAARFKNRINYGRATGMRQIYLWGAEYWYYRKTVLHDDSVWRVAQNAFASSNSAK